MRGKETAVRQRQSSMGITPAYAGKRSTLQPNSENIRDHPRVCGEKCAIVFSPFFGFGITPAYAGKSVSDHCQLVQLRDHPRVCGEKWMYTISSYQTEGSPPRMRGKGDIMALISVKDGITPAYAGKSIWEKLRILTRRDHPRVCGEKTKKIPSHRPFQLHPVPVSFSFA